MKYEIHGWLGKTGSGKTLDETEQAVLDFILSGVEVWTCYWINIDLPNVHYFSEFEEVENLKNAVIVFDEITDFFDPRDWENESKGVRRWFRLHRKHHLHILFNTQDISLVAKTIGTLCHKWYFLKTHNYGWVMSIFKKILGTESDISLQICEMTYQELKKMAVGFEIGEQLEAEGYFKTVNYKIKKILHKELNDLKRELVHRYCPKCESRQGDQIKSKDTFKIATRLEDKKESWKLKQDEFCPFCKTVQLEIRESGIYDTDYEIPIREKKISWQAMTDSPKGWKRIPFSGLLSDRQMKEKRNYEGKHLENGHYVPNN